MSIAQGALFILIRASDREQRENHFGGVKQKGSFLSIQGEKATKRKKKNSKSVFPHIMTL